MYTLFYSDISEFAGNLEVMIDEGTYKESVWNMQKLGWKANYFKSAHVSMLVHGCGVSQHPQNLNNYQILPHLYMWSYSGEMGHLYFNKIGLLHE